jgi:hypothetical protein
MKFKAHKLPYTKKKEKKGEGFDNTSWSNPDKV